MRDAEAKSKLTSWSFILFMFFDSCDWESKFLKQGNSSSHHSVQLILCSMLLISLFLYVQQASVAWQFTLPNFVPKPYFSDLIVNCVHDFLGA